MSFPDGPGPGDQEGVVPSSRRPYDRSLLHRSGSCRIGDRPTDRVRPPGPALPFVPQAVTMSHSLPAQLESLRDLALRAGDVLVFNDSRVIPARFYGRKVDTGGRVEILLLRHSGNST